MLLLPCSAQSMSPNSVWLMVVTYAFIKDEPKTMSAITSYLLMSYGNHFTNPDVFTSKSATLKKSIKVTLEGMVESGMLKQLSNGKLEIPDKWNPNLYEIIMVGKIRKQHDEIDENGELRYYFGKGKKHYIHGAAAERFKRFYDAYGYKRNKSDAVSAWNSIELVTNKKYGCFPEDFIETIISAAAMAGKTHKENELLIKQIKAGITRSPHPTGTPHPATWLNKERWEDDCYKKTVKEDNDHVELRETTGKQQSSPRLDDWRND